MTEYGCAQCGAGNNGCRDKGKSGFPEGNNLSACASRHVFEDSSLYTSLMEHLGRIRGGERKMDLIDEEIGRLVLGR